MDQRHYDKRIPAWENKMTHRTIIAGAGGQGIMLLGKVLAQAAMREGMFVTFLPAYGAEVRGGTANCMVVISDAQIGSPLVQEADSLIVMNEPSLARFAPRISKKGTIFINSSMVSDETPAPAGSLRFPFMGISIGLGDIRVANMVALGCFCEKTKLIAVKSVMDIIDESTPGAKKEVGMLNKKALEAGSQLLKGERGVKNG
jgi:2-oxoglutarate ferredoxin oxidoreductase subunit gamma